MRQGKKIADRFWYEGFLKALKENLGNIVATCNAAGVTPQSYYNRRIDDPVFGKQADRILDQVCVPYLEDIARARAAKGDTRLLVFVLRNRGGRRWNQDRIQEAMAKEEPRIRHEKKLDSKEFEQRLPTRAEKAAAKAYLAALKDEEE